MRKREPTIIQFRKYEDKNNSVSKASPEKAKINMIQINPITIYNFPMSIGRVSTKAIVNAMNANGIPRIA